MSGPAAFRMVFLIVMAFLFVGSLLGILLTGPVVVRNPRIDPGVDVSADRLRADVRTLCADFFPRSARHPENLDRAAAWIAEALGGSGLAVRFQDYLVEGTTYRNVIAERRGRDREAPILVIGAHYDVYGEHAGADDNASGVAVLVELVRTLPETLPPRDQLFVAFSTEEPPFFGSKQMGSHVFARELKSAGTELFAMVSLDMVGYYSELPGSQRFPIKGLGLIYPDRGNFVAIIGDLRAGPGIERVKRGMLATRALPVHSFRASPRWAPVDLSDHRSFRELGLPGVQVTDTAFMRFPHYHTAEDTPEKLDYEKMARLVVALHGVLLEGNEP